MPSPTGNGSTTTADAAWVGLGGITSSDLIQVGTEDTVTASGQVSSSAFYELLPDPSQPIPTVSVSPGDTVGASITETSSNEWVITITNKTSGQTATINTPYTSTNSSAEWIEEDPSYTNGQLQLVPFDDFGTVDFSGASTTANGTTQNLTVSGAEAIEMVDSNGKPEAVPSAIGSGGASFSVTRQ